MGPAGLDPERRSVATTKAWSARKKRGHPPPFEWALQDLNLRPTDYESALVENASLRGATGAHVNAPMPTREIP